MPYLDQGFIRASIRPERVADKSRFIYGGQKNLKDVVDRAIEVHTPARAGRERISLARRRIIAAVRALFPEAKFELANKNGQLSDTPYNSNNYRFYFKQPIFRGGILWNTLLQEKKGLEAAQKEYDAVIQNLINDVSAAYFEYNRSLAVVSDQEKAIEAMHRYVDTSQEKYRSQIISEIENLNVRSLFSQTQYDFETSKQEYELAKLELQRFLDLEMEDKISIAALYQVDDMLKTEKGDENISKSEPVPANPPFNQASDQTAKPSATPAKSDSGKDFPAKNELPPYMQLTEIPDLPTLVDLAYQHRPELEVESAKLQSARLEERIKWGAMVPRADVVLEFGKLGEAFDTVARDPGLREEFRLMLEVNWNVAGNKVGYTFEDDQRAPTVSQFQAQSGTALNRNTFTVGLWDGLNELAEAKEAEVAKLDQVVQLEKAEKETVHDVKQAYFDYQKAKIQVKSSLQRVDYRKRLALLAVNRLEKNEIQISEYLQAEIDLIRETVALHKAIAEDFTSRAKLNHAIGVRDYLAIEAKHGSKLNG